MFCILLMFFLNFQPVKITQITLSDSDNIGNVLPIKDNAIWRMTVIEISIVALYLFKVSPRDHGC